jgi:hypothetical protein
MRCAIRTRGLMDPCPLLGSRLLLPGLGLLRATLTITRTLSGTRPLTLLSLPIGRRPSLVHLSLTRLGTNLFFRTHCLVGLGLICALLSPGPRFGADLGWRGSVDAGGRRRFFGRGRQGQQTQQGPGDRDRDGVLPEHVPMILKLSAGFGRYLDITRELPFG